MAWKPIEGLTDAHHALADSELAALFSIWSDERAHIEPTPEFKKFITQLGRLEAIETGIVEGAYSLSQGTTETLVEQGISADLISREEVSSPERVAAMIRDHEATVQHAMDYVASGRELTTSFIKELHAMMLRNVATHEVTDQFGKVFSRLLLKGDYKKHPNNPTRPDKSVHEYSPPIHVPAEMDRLVELHREHCHFSTEVRAAWLHHAFTQIHPFADGNGRVARVLATMVFVKDRMFPFLLDRDQRRTYIYALEKADLGELAHLIGLFSSQQKKTIRDALQVMPEPETIEEEIAVIVRKRGRSNPRVGRSEELRQLENRLLEWSSAKLEAVSQMVYANEAPPKSPPGLMRGGELQFQFGSLSVEIRVLPLSDEILGLLTIDFIWFLPSTDRRTGDQLIATTRENVEALRSRFDAWFNKNMKLALAEWRKSL